MSFLFILNKWLILRCGQELLKISLENRVVQESRKVLKDQKDGTCIPFNPYVSLGSLNCDNFSRFHLFLMSLTVLRNIGQVFCRLQLTWVCPMFSSWWWVWGRKIIEMKCCSHHSQSGGHDMDITSPWWPWSWSSGWGCVCHFCTAEPLSYCPAYTVPSEASRSAAHVQREGF